MDIGLILLLVLLNGVFAMAEIAVVSSRKARLQKLADQGRPGAAMALALQDEPSRFLSTIQVGITTVGVLSGAIGETVLAEPIAAWLAGVPALAPYARGLALGLTVILITYLSVVVGELVPKRLALLSPEAIAALVAQPMNRLAQAASPLVWLLSASSSVLLRLFGVRRSDQPPVTDDEIEVLMEQGAAAGVFHASERRIVANVLHLDEQPVGAIMTPRPQVYAIDLAAPLAERLQRLADSPYARVLLCDGEQPLGVLQRGDLLKPALAGLPIDLRQAMRAPLYVQESSTSTLLLERFRETGSEFAVVVDAFDDLQGIVTLTDVLGAIVGDIPGDGENGEQQMTRREDGSWLIDGALGIDCVKEALGLQADLPGEAGGDYHTLAGFILHCLGRVPGVGEHCEHAGWRFEVVDMDRARIDKVLASYRGEPGE